MLKKLALLVTLLLVIAVLPFKIQPPSKSPTSSTTSLLDVQGDYDVKNVPEITEILANDQEIRLKAGRRLAERVGVEEALEILEHSSLPHTGEGHLVVHQVGFYAYQKHGIEGILKCKDYFLYACYHGVIIEAASDQGIPTIAKMTDICKSSSVRFFQCVHAAGHAILAMFNYDLSQALKTCDDLYEKETQFPEALSSCHNGAFMENLFGVHDWGKGETSKREWLKDDNPYFPCTAFGEKYQRGCWLNQAARIYQMYQGDVVKTAKACEAIGNRTHTEWCFDNLARQLHPLTNGDITQVFELCKQVGSYWEQGCVIVNAGAFYSVGGRDSGIAICGKLIDEAKAVCYEKLISQIVGDTLTTDEKMALCDRLETPFADACRKRLKLGT